MTRKLAIKLLTASDLSFFAWQFRKNPSSKQKAINLNADVFVEELYPGLKDPSAQDRYSIDIFIYGPGLAGKYNLQRKVVKTSRAKNWRLNGEIVENPEDSPRRFNVLTANDFAIFDFSEGIFPTSLNLVLIAAAISEDKSIHQALNRLLSGSKSMIALSPSELEEVVNAANPIIEHPIYELTVDTDVLKPDVEDIVLGGSGTSSDSGVRTRQNAWASGKRIPRTDLQKAKGTIEFVGLQGEQFVNEYLSTLKSKGQVRDFAWVSDNDAVSPYDFWVSYDGITKTFIDVKSTQGEFERKIHVSFNELLRMRQGPEKYDIYRVFDIKESTAQLRIIKDVAAWAAQVLQVLETLPPGIFSDNVSFSPAILPSNSAIILSLEEQIEE